MKPNLNIDQRINNQKNSLITRLTEEIKFPILNIEKLSFDQSNYQGVFSITLDQNRKQSLVFHYENQEFSWNIESIISQLNSCWNEVFCSNQDDIIEQIVNQLEMNIDDLTKITTGKKNVIYLYIDGEDTSIRVFAEYNSNEWSVSIPH